MGALVNHEQRQPWMYRIVNRQIQAGCEVCWAVAADLNAAGHFFRPTLCFCPQPDETRRYTPLEAFGPVATLMPYQIVEHAMALAQAGEGSLVGIAGNRQAKTGA